MPQVVGGWWCSLLCTLGGGKLYILGVAGFITPIWDVLAPKGERDEAAEHLYSAKFENYVPIRQAVPVGLARARFCSWAHWARFFIEKKGYCSRFNIFTYNLQFYKPLGMREWMDGRG